MYLLEVLHVILSRSCTIDAALTYFLQMKNVGCSVYFATSFDYSDVLYAKTGHAGTQRIFLSSVITGEFVVGNPTYMYLVASPKPGKPEQKCESVANDVVHPTEYIVFRDWSSCPMHLITLLKA